MVPLLTQRAAKDAVQLSTAEAALWGAILYRCFNRLSTFSRWAAAQALAKKLKLPLSAVLKRASKGASSLYEAAVHGSLESRREELHSIAASGVTLLGRNGCRDKWGKDTCLQHMSGKRKTICCVAELPLPSELHDFKTFLEWEVSQGRGVMTGEHQVQPRVRVLSVLGKLAANKCSRLKKLSLTFRETRSAKVVMDELRKFDTVGDFFAWQIFSDLVAVQYHCQLFPTDTILPSAVVKDSLFDYALFGPGARKGACIIDGDAANVLESDKDANQAATLQRAKKILADFPAALERTKLDKSWARCAQGRAYDLETIEHSLCGFYGVMKRKIPKVLAADGKASKEMARAAREANCVWPPASLKGASHGPSTLERLGTSRCSWKPNPSTAMERLDLQQMVKAAQYVQSAGSDIKKEDGV